MSNGNQPTKGSGATWKDVVQSERYKNLPVDQRVRVADFYFSNNVAPKLPEGKLEEARDKWYEGVIKSDPDIAREDIGKLQSTSMKDYLSSPRGQRLALEVTGGMLGGGVGKLAVKGARGVKRFLAETGGVGGGSAVGSLGAEGVDPTEEPLETAKEAALFGVLGEVGGRTVGRMILGPRKGGKNLEPGAKEAVEQLEGRATPTPGQLTENSIIDMTEQVAEGSILGGKSLTKTRERAAHVAQEDVENLVDDLSQGLTREQSGVLAKHALENRTEVFRDTAQGLFRKVDELTEGATVNPSSIRKRAKELEEELQKGLSGQAAGAKGVTREIQQRTQEEVVEQKLKLGDNKVMELVEEVSTREKPLTFAEAQAIRSDLAAIGRTDDPISTRARGIAKQLAKTIDDAMERSSENLSGDGLKAFRRANKYYKKGAEVFNDAVIRKISRSNPEEVGRILSQAENPTQVKKIKQVLKKDKKTWDAVRGNVISQWLRKSINAESGEASAKKFLNNMKNYGEDALTSLLNNEERARLRRLARTLSITQSKASDVGGFDVAIKLMQGSAAGGLLFYGDSPGGAAGILLGPTALAKVLSRPKVVKRLTVGLKKPKGSTEARRALTQLSSQLADTPGVTIYNDVPKEEMLENTAPMRGEQEDNE